MVSAMEIKIKQLSKKAIPPKYAHSGDAGIDFFTVDSKTLKPGQWHAFSTGIAMEIPAGFAGLVWDKSGLSSKFGLHVLAGVIDSSFRGEVKIVIYNLGSHNYQFKAGDKVAQMLIQPFITAKTKLVKNLSNSARGQGGFGSTGRS